MHDRIGIVENTRVQFLPGASYKVIKLCLSVLNDDSMVVHQTCIYDTFQPSTKTCLYDFDPLKPHFYLVKTGVYRGIHYVSYSCSKTYVLSRNKKNIRLFFLKIFIF